MEDRIKSLETSIASISDKLDLLIKQNEIIMNRQVETDKHVEKEMDRVFDRIGGDDLADIMTKLRDIDFDSVVYVCDHVTDYRKNGVFSWMKRPLLRDT